MKFVWPLAVALLVSCSSPVCSAANCPMGCCDSAGQCQAGDTVSECGTNAARCQLCGAAEQCAAHACVSTAPIDAGHDAGHSTDSGNDAGPDAAVADAGIDAGGDAGSPDAGRPRWFSDAGCRTFDVPSQRLTGGYRVEGPYEWSFATAGFLSATQLLDEVNVDLVWSAGGVAPVTGADLSLEPNYRDCRHCVVYRDRCRIDGTECMGVYFARRGQLNITRAPRGQITTTADGGTLVTAPPFNAPMSVQLRNVRLQRWDIGSDVPLSTDCVELYDGDYTVLFR